MALTGNFVGVIDSLTNSYGSDNAYLTQLAALLGVDWNVVSGAVNGKRIDEANTDAATNILPHYNAAYHYNFLGIIGGTNDILQGASAATCMSRMAAFDITVSGYGFILIHCPIPNLEPGSFDAVQASFASLIRSTYPAKNIADLLADSRLADANNSIYFQTDKVHPTGAGDTVIASIMNTTLSNYINPPTKFASSVFRGVVV